LEGMALSTVIGILLNLVLPKRAKEEKTVAEAA
jgi:xanthine/uracil permease